MSVRFISKFNRRIALVLIIGLPVVSGSVGLYFYLKNKTSTFNSSNNSNLSISSVNSEDEASIYKGINVFPELKVKDFYNYIRIEKNEAIINDNFIAAVISYVVKNANIIGGELLYSYYQVNKQQLQTVFKWISDTEVVIEKTYLFSLIT